MFVSFGLRFRVNVEAMNMVESFGNYTRHRTAPLLRKTDNGYEVVFAPVVSGQAIAHAFMRALADLELNKIGVTPLQSGSSESGSQQSKSSKTEPRLCEDCKNYQTIGGFLKRSGDANTLLDNRVKTCIVDDVTGFMATKSSSKSEKEGKSKAMATKSSSKSEKEGESEAEEKGSSIRRTSRIMFSYMIPDIDAARATIFPQFHVRFNNIKNENAIFQIESGSAVYMLTIHVNVSGIGQLSTEQYVEDRIDRVDKTFTALMTMFSGSYIGAKHARYLPIIEFLGGIAAISKPMPFSVSPPKRYDYVADTLQRAYVYVNNIKDECIKIFYFDNEELIKVNENKQTTENQSQTQGCIVNVTRKTSLEELIAAVKEDVMEELKKNSNKK
ncbi:DevR family CRISPR-associated autoregulator [Sulfolobus sp. E5-1-F]|uniref:DevR family CRISPR-associated autoregulator n=1 Tax=Saccharolobus sp. E5-1-F TaxID=2663019 RepID=UPI0012952195|nr:DevR family CRISPR-associated autoregulator [Sulfolobus sp. E5-1-F]QGA53932.1 DevR family CRISPR-associated autoregulator [Sulfolobus sp. E5-1-F]